jgi:hypothetical protein
MNKNEIIKLLKPKCNGYDLPLSLNIELIAELLVENKLILSGVVGIYSQEEIEGVTEGVSEGVKEKLVELLTLLT